MCESVCVCVQRPACGVHVCALAKLFVAMLNDTDLPECFVCTDTTPTPRKSACKCTDRYVHDTCLKRMLKSCSHAACPVCAAPYANVRSSSRIVGLKWTSPGVCGCGMVLVAVALLGLATSTWHVLCCTHRNLSTVDVGVVSGAAVMMSVVGIGLLAILARMVALRGLAMLIQSMILRELKVRVLATPARTLPAEVAMADLAVAPPPSAVEGPAEF